MPSERFLERLMPWGIYAVLAVVALVFGGALVAEVVPDVAPGRGRVVGFGMLVGAAAMTWFAIVARRAGTARRWRPPTWTQVTALVVAVLVMIGLILAADRLLRVDVPVRSLVGVVVVVGIMQILMGRDASGGGGRRRG